MKAIYLSDMDCSNGVPILIGNKIILVDKVYHTNTDFIFVFGNFWDPECSEWIDGRNFDKLDIGDNVELLDAKFEAI